MKKSEWNDEQLENLLKQMPIVKDKRSPGEIYQNISHRVKKDENNHRRKWMIPSLATVAAALILLIMLPTFFNDFSLSRQDNASMESTHDQNATIMMDSESKQSEEPSTEKMQILEEDNNQETTDNIDESDATSHDRYVVWEEDLGDKIPITYNVPHESLAFFVPLTILVEPEGQNPIELMTEHMSVVNGVITQSNWGLGAFPSQYYDFLETTKKNGIKTVRADVKEELNTESFSSIESYAFTEGLQSFRWFDKTNYKEVEIFQNGEQHVMIGQTGVEQPTIALNQKLAYFYYSTPGSETETGFLVPTPYQYIGYPESFQSALDTMKNEVQLGELLTLEPSIKEDVTIENVIDDVDNIVIEFSSESNLTNTEEDRRMIEAIMLTARDFGFQTVTFHGNVKTIGNIPFDTPVSVPVSPNPISYQ